MLEFRPGLQDKPPGSVLAELSYFLFFQNPEGFAGEVVAVDISRIKDVAEFLLGQSVESGVVSVKFSSEKGSALFIPFEE